MLEYQAWISTIFKLSSFLHCAFDSARQSFLWQVLMAGCLTKSLWQGLFKFEQWTWWHDIQVSMVFHNFETDFWPLGIDSFWVVLIPKPENVVHGFNIQWDLVGLMHVSHSMSFPFQSWWLVTVPKWFSSPSRLVDHQCQCADGRISFHHCCQSQGSDWNQMGQIAIFRPARPMILELVLGLHYFLILCRFLEVLN